MDGKNLPHMTLCLLVEGDPAERVLLGFKKSGLGAGKYTGFGGKVEPGEDITAAAARELNEEAGVQVALSDLCEAGRLAFWFPHRPDWSQLVHVYATHKWTGVPVESDEMRPAWFDVNQVPYKRMWQDAQHWLPPVLAGRRVYADFVFQADNESIHEVNLVLKERS